MLTVSSFITYNSTIDTINVKLMGTAISSAYFAMGFYYGCLYNPATFDANNFSTYVDPIFVNVFPLVLLTVELIFDAIVLDYTSCYVPVCFAFLYLITNLWYTLATNNNYISFWTWIDTRSWLMGLLFLLA